MFGKTTAVMPQTAFNLGKTQKELWVKHKFMNGFPTLGIKKIQLKSSLLAERLFASRTKENIASFVNPISVCWHKYGLFGDINMAE